MQQAARATQHARGLGLIPSQFWYGSRWSPDAQLYGRKLSSALEGRRALIWCLAQLRRFGPTHAANSFARNFCARRCRKQSCRRVHRRNPLGIGRGTSDPNALTRSPHPLLIASLLGLEACAATLQPALPEPDVELGLGDVVLLTWTTRSPAGLLGHAMLPDAIGVDPHRRVVDGNAHWVGTSQRMRFMFTRERAVQVKVDAVTAGASTGVAQATHIAYDVHLTRYLELPPDSLRYAPASCCCLEGQVTSSCGEWYVIRMMWGSGRVQFLQQVSANASISASELLRAEGGTAYRRLNEISFEDAFFAYEAVPLADLCASVQPEDELTAMFVRAPRNCWMMAQRNDGTNATMTWHLGHEQACRDVVGSHCARQKDLMSCHMTFTAGDQTTSATIPIDAFPRTIEAAPIAASPKPVAASTSPVTGPAATTAPAKGTAATKAPPRGAAQETPAGAGPAAAAASATSAVPSQTPGTSTTPSN